MWKCVSEAPTDGRQVLASFVIKAGAAKDQVVYFIAYAHPAPYGVRSDSFAKPDYWMDIPKLDIEQ